MVVVRFDADYFASFKNKLIFCFFKYEGKNAKNKRKKAVFCISSFNCTSTVTVGHPAAIGGLNECTEVRMLPHWLTTTQL